MNVDINQVKNMAQDIIQREEKPMNAPNLMSSDSSRPENKFFVDLNMAEESIRKEPLPFKVQSAVDAINRRIEEIKLQGTFVRKEEKSVRCGYRTLQLQRGPRKVLQSKLFGERRNKWSKLKRFARKPFFLAEFVWTRVWAEPI